MQKRKSPLLLLSVNREARTPRLLAAILNPRGANVRMTDTDKEKSRALRIPEPLILPRLV